MRDPYPEEGGKEPSMHPVAKGFLIFFAVLIIAVGVCAVVVTGIR